MKRYRTIWIDVDDWRYLQRIAVACGLSGSELTSQAAAAFVERCTRAYGIDDMLLTRAEGGDLSASHAVRERVAEIVQEMIGKERKH